MLRWRRQSRSPARREDFVSRMRFAARDTKQSCAASLMLPAMTVMTAMGIHAPLVAPMALHIVAFRFPFPLLHFPLCLLCPFPVFFGAEVVSFPVGTVTVPVVPVSRFTIVTYPFMGVPAELVGQGLVTRCHPWSVIMGRPVPGIAAVEVVGAADKENVVRDTDRHVEAEFGGFDEQRRFIYDNGRCMVDRRWRCGYHDCRRGTDIDADTYSNVAGKCM